MKNRIFCLTVVSILLFAFFYCGLSEKETAFYISESGNDSWSGRLTEPNADDSDGPFATLEKAKQAVRDLKKEGSLPDGGVTIYIREGIYSIKSTFKLTAEDSGTEISPVTWRSYPDEKVHLIGGRVITGFDKVTDSSVLKCMDKSTRENVLQLRLSDLGLTDFGEIKSSGMGRPLVPTGMELFFKGKAMTIARYPNEGWLQIKHVPQNGKKLYCKGASHTPKDGIPRGRNYGRFTYDGNRPGRWAKNDNIWIHGYWTWDWADAYLKAGRIDKRKKTIYPEDPEYHYGFTKEQRFYFLNILEELDSPGEWYLDRKDGILYFWPPSEIGEKDVFVSLLEDLMISLENTSYITIQGFIFEGSRGTCAKITGGTYNKFAGCTIRNVGNNGVEVEGGTYNGVLSCDIHDTGDGGIIMTGGDRKTITPGHNYITNNHIYRFSRVNFTARRAIRIKGVGNLVSHNYMHDAPHEAIYFSGNEHIIEFNEIHNIVQQTGDAGASHTGRDYTWRGTILRYNYLHDLHGPGLFGVMGIYLDDFQSGTTVFGNIFYKAGRAAFMGGGRNNVIENNIFVDCEASVHIDARGKTWAKNYFDGRYNWLWEKLDAMNYKEPPYIERYPDLKTLVDDDPADPKYNKVLRNVSSGGKFFDIEDGVDASIMTIKNNLIADDILCFWRGAEVKDAKTGTTYKRGDREFTKKLEGNQIIDGDPGFVDRKDSEFSGPLDFRLKEDSPAWKLGFQKIPVEKIGLYIDEYRTSLPVRKE